MGHKCTKTLTRVDKPIIVAPIPNSRPLYTSDKVTLQIHAGFGPPCAQQALPVCTFPSRSHLLLIVAPTACIRFAENNESWRRGVALMAKASHRCILAMYTSIGLVTRCPLSNIFFELL